MTDCLPVDKIRKAEAEKQLQQQKKEPLKASDVFSSGSDEEVSSESETSSSFQGDSDDEAGSRCLCGLSGWGRSSCVFIF